MHRTKYFHLVLAFSIAQILFGQSEMLQFFIVDDNDGYVLVRATADKSGKVIDTLYSADMFFVFEQVGNWCNVDYGARDSSKSGFIYYNRLKKISNYTVIPKVLVKGNTVILEKDSLRIALRQTPFVKKGHRYTYSKINHGHLEKIDGHSFWGQDGGMPGRHYKDILLISSGDTMALPSSAIFDLYEPNSFYTKAYLDAYNDRLFIESSNSDGAGAYSVIWLIENGRYKNRLVVYGF